MEGESWGPMKFFTTENMFWEVVWWKFHYFFSAMICNTTVPPLYHYCTTTVVQPSDAHKVFIGQLELLLTTPYCALWLSLFLPIPVHDKTSLLFSARVNHLLITWPNEITWPSRALVLHSFCCDVTHQSRHFIATLQHTEVLSKWVFYSLSKLRSENARLCV